uniref:Uncharacterized protein n=1 Tax=Romanomermis culicivorax TaxID=13658 RepID=A0A915K7P8_ROMCU
MLKVMVGALIRGYYKTFAVNAASLVSGPLLECLSMKMMTKCASLSGSLLWRSLLISATFSSRLPVMEFVRFDLYEQDRLVNFGQELKHVHGEFAVSKIFFDEKTRK